MRGDSNIVTLQTRDAQLFQKSKRHLKILGARRMTHSKFNNKDPQLLGATVQNSVAMATSFPRCVHFCFKSPLVTLRTILFDIQNLYVRPTQN
jgi:hypothetical protein